MWVFLFSGQSSQFVGMGRSFAGAFPQSRYVFEEASDVLSYDMKKLCFQDPLGQIHQTEYTQPAILTVSIAIFQVLKDIIPVGQPSGCQMMAGHSVGEYTAHAASQTFDFSEGLKLLRQRGRWMQEAVKEGEGGMVACLGLSFSDVSRLLKRFGKSLDPHLILEPAIYNTSLQTVLSGHQKAIDKLLKADLKPLDLSRIPKFLPLKVSAPFHCSLMQPVQDKIAPLIHQMPFKSPKAFIVPNISAQKTSNILLLKKALIEQITAPVKWEQTMEHLKTLGFCKFIEIGPGKILSGFLKSKIDGKFTSLFINSPKDFDKIKNII